MGCGLLLFAFSWKANWNVLVIVAFRHSLFSINAGHVV